MAGNYEDDAKFANDYVLGVLDWADVMAQATGSWPTVAWADPGLMPELERCAVPEMLLAHGITLESR